MKKSKYTVLAFFILVAAFSAAKAQQSAEPETTPQNNMQTARRPNLLAELDLTKDQIQQIRQINADNKLIRRNAVQKLRDAQQNLDQAIYADTADETVINTMIRDVHSAQKEVLRLRVETEFAVRKVLTPEQLTKFREIRRRFMERTENLPKRQNVRPLNAPNQRIINRQRRLRNNN